MVQSRAERTHVQDSGANVYCAFCELWLVDQVQWEGHLAGKKHRRQARGWPFGSRSHLSGPWSKA
eukprot:9178606-Lingulodinium_polyedra.AAC.1